MFDLTNSVASCILDRTMAETKIPARELQTGDICLGSGAVIVRGAQRGARTPAGKVEVVVKYPRKRSESGYGEPRVALWGSGTQIPVRRGSE